LERSAAPVPVGMILRQPDRAWLAGVLSRWAAEQRLAAPAPAVPGNGAVTVERGPGGRLTVRWQPSDLQLLRDRQAMAGGVLVPIILAPILATMGWMVVTMLLALRKDWNVWGVGGVVFVLLCMAGLSRALARLFPGLWYALRGPRWARLTLTPQALEYR